MTHNDVSGWNFAQQYLTEAEFFRATLIGADLSQANLTGADFRFATLTAADLSHSDLRSAKFDDITLSSANLSHANLAGARFKRATLASADLSGANLAGARFEDTTLTDADLSGATVLGAFFEAATSHGFTAEQLYSTVDYQSGDLSGIGWSHNNLTGWDFSGQNLTEADFRESALTGADLSHAVLTEADFFDATLANAKLRHADLSGGDLRGSDLTNADLTEAVVAGASFEDRTPGGVSGLTREQLYSTASYKNREMPGIQLRNHNLAGWNFAGQNLTRARFDGATLTDADLSYANLTRAIFGRGSDLTGVNLSDAVVTGAFFERTTLTKDQLYTTASYKNKDLSGIRLGRNDLTGWNFAGQYLTGASFRGATLRSADLTGADLRAAHVGNLHLGDNTRNVIWPDGIVFELDLQGGESLWIRDYDGLPEESPPIPITVFEDMSVSDGGLLRIIFEADAWDSTISFEPGIEVQLGGTLELDFAGDVDVAAQVGRTLRIFNWTGVNPDDKFDVNSDHVWDLSNLYSTGEVRLLSAGAVPEPGSLAMGAIAALIVGICGLCRRSSRKRIGTFGGEQVRMAPKPAQFQRVPSYMVCAFAAFAMVAVEPAKAAGNYTPLIVSGRPENRIDIVVIGDGYTSEQLPIEYRQHVNGLVDYMFDASQGGVFARYRNFFNVHEVAVASNESGSDVHRVNGPFRDTALGAAYFWNAVSPQSLGIRSGDADRIAADALPSVVLDDIEMQIALVNDRRLGGTGGSWATYAAGNSNAVEVAIHEIGHSFAGLADEYFTLGTTYTGAEPQEPNVTAGTNKWDRWQGYVDPDHPQLGPVDYYEGGKYRQIGIYRPTQTSRMRHSNQPWNAVSREAIIGEIYREVRPLDDWLDNEQMLVNPQNVWVDAVDASVFAFEWFIGGVAVSDAAGEVLNVSLLRQTPGDHTVSVRVYDRVLDHAFTGGGLDWWRKDDPSPLEQHVEWSIRSTLAGDFNGDGFIEQGDLDLVLMYWGQYSLPPESGWIGDLPTGDISQNHLDAVLLNWGRATVAAKSASSIPEPNTAALLVIALCVLCRFVFRILHLRTQTTS